MSRPHYDLVSSSWPGKTPPFTERPWVGFSKEGTTGTWLAKSRSYQGAQGRIRKTHESNETFGHIPKPKRHRLVPCRLWISGQGRDEEGSNDGRTDLPCFEAALFVRTSKNWIRERGSVDRCRKVGREEGFRDLTATCDVKDSSFDSSLSNDTEAAGFLIH